MSGHSKWATIKRQKGATDAKRGQLFTKLSNAITIAVKQGGGVTDMNSNFKLRLAVDKARAANMPKENIERAIERASGVGSAAVEEFLYEGFAPGGVALMVEAVTDNKQRTVSDVKNAIDKNGGTMGSSGSVSYLFKRVGEIVLAKNGQSGEELLEKGIEAGAEDMEEEDDSVYFYVEPQNLDHTKKNLEAQGVTVQSAQLIYMPLTEVNQDEETQRRVLSIVEKLEELDDVQQVYTNLG
ncbi:MAG TPA: YebC/PmpR family DNA-binding transcriptional regulator [Patescibacteria group bacterium]|nr:YebC/PmpR family DNA-binding transcriptional regulator [Patescibacteria group bacterium]